MKTKTVLSLLLLAVCLMFTMAGCGGSDEDAAGDAQTQNEQAAQQEQAAEGTIRFQTTDLDGNRVDSKELFAQNKVTMINVWGTFCGPCVREMPELETIRKEYADQGAAVVGLVVDVPEGNDAYLPEAEEIIDVTGVTYQNIRAWDGIQYQLDASVIPVTYFVDSQGEQVCDPVVGADVFQYRANLDQFLQGQ